MSHTRGDFDSHLSRLRLRLLEMGAEVDEMLGDALRALLEQDLELAQRVIRADDRVDNLDIEIETECIRLIARQAPVASDLRLIGTALKVITDLERMADHAVDIAKIGRRLARNAYYLPLIDLPALGSAVRQMLRDALASLVGSDLDLVAKVIAADDAVDDLYHSQRDLLIQTMERDNSVVYIATYLLLAAKHFERVADHVVNVAERVYYVETGTLAQLAASHSSAAAASG